MTARSLARAEALAQGLTTYLSDTPCKRGHLSERLVSNYGCLECLRLIAKEKRRADPEKARARDKAQRERNPEKVAAALKKYRDANRDAINARMRAARAADGPEREARLAARRENRRKNAEEIRERERLQRAANPEAHRARAKRHYDKDPKKARERAKAWREANPEKRAEYMERAGKEKMRAYVQANAEGLREYQRKWRQENRDVVYAHIHKRRALKKSAGGTHTSADLKEIFVAQRGCCAYCRADLRKVKKHLDHIVPLVRGGSNDRTNLQFLCGPCNLSKGSRDPITFAQERGLLI